MKALFDDVSVKASRAVTRRYSTSFSLGIHFLNKNLRDPIHGIYGFVRLADEIVDSFHDFDKASLLAEFSRETFLSIDRGISLNPVLNSFQHVVRRYQIDHELIRAFLHSMEMDLDQKNHSSESYKQYILGSAEVVGLMCLHVFVNGDKSLYLTLKPYAMALGSAFQKVNFLRDLNADLQGLGRRYFPELGRGEINDPMKSDIERDIENDFRTALQGIRLLPKQARLGVYVAYIYYLNLFSKIRKTSARNILDTRIRIPNGQKILLFAHSYVRNSLNIL